QMAVQLDQRISIAHWASLGHRILCRPSVYQSAGMKTSHLSSRERRRARFWRHLHRLLQKSRRWWGPLLR
ncbi:MAG TPA: hypothetical protein VII86_10815, partial [Thermoanaerobaculia bacterium]